MFCDGEEERSLLQDGQQSLSWLGHLEGKKMEEKWTEEKEDKEEKEKKET